MKEVPVGSECKSGTPHLSHPGHAWAGRGKENDILPGEVVQDGLVLSAGSRLRGKGVDINKLLTGLCEHAVSLNSNLNFGRLPTCGRGVGDPSHVWRVLAVILPFQPE